MQLVTGNTQPRSRRFRGRTALAAAVVIAVTSTGLAVAKTDQERGAANASANRIDFDFETGNSALEVVYPLVQPAIRKDVSSGTMDASIVLRFVVLIESGWFDAIAPYNETAVGFYGDLGRRPADEGKTEKNRNISMMYASYHVLNSLMPKRSAEWRDMMTSVGLDPDDKSEDKTTPVGIGNLAGKATIKARANDGMNQLGNEGGQKYNKLPYKDYTGYAPVNTPEKLRNPSRWQPDITTNGQGIFSAQQFVTPQMGKVKPYTYDNPEMFDVAPPKNSNHKNRKAYKRQVDEVLAQSANLTDEQKMMAEYFDDKLVFLAENFPDMSNGDYSLENFVQTAVGVHIATFDTTIAVWHYKAKYDAVRPFSAIEHVYGDKPVTSWGGPGKGTVKDMPATQWRGWLQTADHAEYPSGSSGICASAAAVGQNFTGKEEIELKFPVKKGSSEGEPGMTPKKDIELSWNSWGDFVHKCGQSRQWGGVHFRPSIDAAEKLGAEVGDRAYKYLQNHIKGNPKGSVD